MSIVNVERSVSYTLTADDGKERTYTLTTSNGRQGEENLLNVSDGSQEMDIPYDAISFLTGVMRSFAEAHLPS